MTLEQAIEQVRMGQAERIAAPGQWKVWREGETVRHEILPNSHDGLNPPTKEADKLVRNGTQVTATGLTGTNLASGVMT